MPVKTSVIPTDAIARAAMSGSGATQLQFQIAIREAVAFSQMIAILSRSTHHKHYTLADLEWLVVPPLVSGQFYIAEGKTQQDGPSMPLGLVFWATVSLAVDQRLSSNLATPMRLHPSEWRSGEILWLIEVAGETRAITGLLNQVVAGPLKGRVVKLRTVGEDGRPLVKELAAKPAA